MYTYYTQHGTAGCFVKEYIFSFLACSFKIAVNCSTDSTWVSGCCSVSGYLVSICGNPTIRSFKPLKDGSNDWAIIIFETVNMSSRDRDSCNKLSIVFHKKNTLLSRHLWLNSVVA